MQSKATTCHICQTGNHQKDHKQQVLPRMRRKRNPCALLVRMQIDTATMENSMEVLQTGKHTTAIEFSNSTSQYFSKPRKPTNLKRYLYSQGFPHSSVSKESACNARDIASFLGSGRPPGEGNGNPLQYSCLENPMDSEEPGKLQSMGSQELDTT